MRLYGFGILLAGAAWGQVVESAKGPVEFIGLENWTPAMVAEKMGRMPDGGPHYCAADLKAAGFASASVIIYVGEDKKWYTVVAVVEGKRAGEMRYQTAAFAGKDGKERAAAAKTLKGSGDRDEAWRALAAGLRDSDEGVSMASGDALNWLRAHAARKVDWAPAAADLAAVLHGTNLFGFQTLVKTLAATGVDRSLAPALLGNGGGRLLLLHLAAHHKEEREAAHALLVQLRGEDLGDAPEAWTAWIGALGA